MTGQGHGQEPGQETAALRALRAVQGAIGAQASELDRLDAEIGDGDLGRNLVQGLDAACSALAREPAAAPDTALVTIATALAGAPGAAARLYATGCRAAGATLAGQAQPGPRDLAAAFETAVAAIQEKCGAVIGDKTLIDVLRPAADALRVAVEDGEPLATALERAGASARVGMIETMALPGRKGQAGERGEAAIGVRDPGAVSAYLLVETLARLAGAVS